MAGPSRTLFRGSFHDGLVRDTARHLLGTVAVYDSRDFLLHVPGVAEKRGGWERQSLQLGASTSVRAVATLHNPTRVVGVGDDGSLYDVTSENTAQADSIGACWAPTENPPEFVNGLVFCDPDGLDNPKLVSYDPGGDVIQITDLYGGAADPSVAGSGATPTVSRSTAHLSWIVGGCDHSNDAAFVNIHQNRLWVIPDPVLEPDVILDETFIDTNGNLEALASIGGVLLVFHPDSIERVLGSIPYGRPGENMALQPLEPVGTFDARSVVHMGTSVVFANAEGVWACTGAGVDSLTKGTIGATLWRGLFPQHVYNEKDGLYVAAGALRGDFYVVSLLTREDTPEPVETLMCHVPTRAWTRLQNTFGFMFASGLDEQKLPDLYMASATEGYVEKLGPILRSPVSGADGDGTPVEPLLELSFGDAGALKKYGGGRLTYLFTAGDEDAPELAVTTAQGVEPETFLPAATFTAGATVDRASFDSFQTRQQHVTVRLEQTGASARTAIFGVEVDVTAQDGGVVT